MVSTPIKIATLLRLKLVHTDKKRTLSAKTKQLLKGCGKRRKYK